MKRKLIVSILGAAASSVMVATSYGQGNILFANYEPADTGSPAAAVTFGTGAPAGEAGFYVGSEFTAELLYSYTGMSGGIAGPVGGFDVATSSLGAAGTVAFNGTDAATTTPGGAGYFSFTDPNNGNSTVAVTGYTSGSVNFEVYVSGMVNGKSYIGTSSLFTVAGPLATTANGLPPGDMFNNGTLTPGAVLTPFSVNAVPEPTTITLAGLGVASLLALRRRK